MMIKQYKDNIFSLILSSILSAFVIYIVMQSHIKFLVHKPAKDIVLLDIPVQNNNIPPMPNKNITSMPKPEKLMQPIHKEIPKLKPKEKMPTPPEPIKNIHKPPPPAESQMRQDIIPKPSDYNESIRKSTTQTQSSFKDIKSPISSNLSKYSEPSPPPNNKSIKPSKDELGKYASLIRNIIESHKRYPERAKRNDEQGSVLLSITLSEDGDVLNVKLLKSSGSFTLDEYSKDLIKQIAKFPPPPTHKVFVFNLNLNYTIH